MSVLDDLVPEPLQTWDQGVLNRLRARGVMETLFFEFKELFAGDDVEKNACAFANRLGGYLLFGVTTASKTDNQIDQYPGLDPSDWLIRVTDNIVGHISPLPVWDTVQIESPDVAGKWVVVTRVEMSTRTPHVLTKSGRIYQRYPAGSSPVTDKSEIDTLVSRGLGGGDAARTQADRLHQRSWGSEYTSQSGSPYIIQIAAVPSPPLGDSPMRAILTSDGFTAAGGILTGPSLRGAIPKVLLEDGVILIAGRQAITRFADGSVFLREEFVGSYIDLALIARHVEGILEAVANQHPEVHQAHLDFRLLQAGERKPDPDGQGANPAARPLGQQLWVWARETGTGPSGRKQVVDEIARRLWRTVGDRRGFEPA